jgi:hypothetical protein
MKTEKIAEKQFPKYDSPSLIATINEDDIVERERSAFMQGLELLPQLAEFIHKNPNIVIQENGYWINPGVDMSYKELVEYFLNSIYNK